MKIDVHQHLWTEQLVESLAQRQEFPFVRHEQGLAVLYLAGERPFAIDVLAEAPSTRAALVEQDGLDRALLCLSSPLGIEWLPRPEARALIDAYHEGVLALGEPFGGWASLPLVDPDPDDVDAALEQGFAGVSLPAGALAGVAAIAHVEEVLARLEARGAPLLVHPGPGAGSPASGAGVALAEPLWWPALTSYVAGMHAAWLAFLAVGRPRHRELRVVFAMLGGLAPLQAERLRSRGGPHPLEPDPLTFYDSSSYGPATVTAVAAVVGDEQLLYGSDRPVVDPGELGMPRLLDWDPVIAATQRAFEHAREALLT